MLGVVAAAPGCSHRPAAAPPGAVGLSPGGVTTRVDIPADSTEEEYYQACHAAKEWMDAQPKTGASLFEPYLAMVQASPSGTAGSWNTPWSALTPARQAAVIVTDPRERRMRVTAPRLDKDNCDHG